ncbi:amidase [Penicillium verhagenii]|nr:amidase [Penicillium verhagenii]
MVTPVSGPCTVIRLSSAQLTPEALLTIRAQFSQEDVWKAGFLQSLIIQPRSPLHAIQISTAAQQTLDKWHTRVLSTRSSKPSDIPDGPYFCNAGDLYQVYRLYPDTAEAFMSATIQSPNDPHLYQYLNVSMFTGEYPTALTVAVPSRLHYTPTEDKPLAGLRIAVKDTQDVRGIRTTGSSRAYAQLYGPRKASSTGVQRLLNQGAIVIGKLKATQFGEAEFATRDWVDYHPPWNPRADGYQTPGASSSGSGVAMAAYNWLDLATGTDCRFCQNTLFVVSSIFIANIETTGSGSIRAPAAIHGLFGIRPSTDAIGNEGVIPFSKNFDTFGVFTREIGTLVSAASTLYTKEVDGRTCFKPKYLIPHSKMTET